MSYIDKIQNNMDEFSYWYGYIIYNHTIRDKERSGTYYIISLKSYRESEEYDITFLKWLHEFFDLENSQDLTSKIKKNSSRKGKKYLYVSVPILAIFYNISTDLHNKIISNNNYIRGIFDSKSSIYKGDYRHNPEIKMHYVDRISYLFTSMSVQNYINGKSRRVRIYGKNDILKFFDIIYENIDATEYYRKDKYLRLKSILNL